MHRLGIWIFNQLPHFHSTAHLIMLDWILLPSVTGSTRLGVGGRYLFWASLFYLPVISRDGGDLSTRKELDSLLTNRWAPDAPDAPNAPSFTPSLLPLGLDGLPPPLLASHLVRHSTACDVRIDANKWHWQSKKKRKAKKSSGNAANTTTSSIGFETKVNPRLPHSKKQTSSCLMPCLVLSIF